MSKPEMSRRIRRRYQAILLRDSNNYDHISSWSWKHNRNSHAWAAYIFYKQFGGRNGVDFHRLQRMVLKGPGELILLWARDIKGANLKKCHAAILEKGDPKMLRMYAEAIPGARKEELENMAVIKEVLAA
jgi:hypothetical protein